MKIHDVKQNSDEWFKLRCGIITASEFDALVSPEWKIREGKGVDTYLTTKAAERWLGRPLQMFGGGAMEQGAILEGEAIPAFEFANDLLVSRVGFITSENGRCGCSPDGLIVGEGTGPIEEEGGIEVKCVQPHTHIGYLLRGTLPKEHAAQVHGSMFVTGAKQWRFMSYCRGFPPLVLIIERDAKAMKAIGAAVEAFIGQLDVAYARLVELNGGEPTGEFMPTIQDDGEIQVATMAGISPDDLKGFYGDIL